MADSQRLYFEVCSALLVVVGMALSWWSFLFTEDGATPDRFDDSGSFIGFEQPAFEMGVRARARQCARTLFFAGGIFVVAGSPMGIAADFATSTPNWPEIVAYVAVVSALTYLVRGVVRVWQARRDDAFGLWFGNMGWLYDAEKAGEIFRRDNPMPIWTVFRREWRSSIKRPDIYEVTAKASKKHIGEQAAVDTAHTAPSP